MSRPTLAFIYFGHYPSDFTALNSRMTALLPELASTYDLTLVSMSPIRSKKSTDFTQTYVISENPKLLKIALYFKVIFKTAAWAIRKRHDFDVFYYYHPYAQTSLLALVINSLFSNTVVEMTELESSRPSISFKSRLLNIKAKLEEAMIKRLPNLLLTISDSLRAYYVHTLQRNKKTSVLPVVFEESYSKVADVNERCSNRLLYLGTFADKDGVPFIIKGFHLALNELQDLKLDLIGSGTSLNQCKQLVKTLGIEDKVNFRGSIPSLEVPSMLKEIDTLIMNRDDSEYSNFGFPTKLANYMVTQIPIVCSKTKSLSQVPANTILFYEPNNVEDFASKIVERYSSNKISDMVSAARQYALKTFSPSIVGGIMITELKAI